MEGDERKRFCAECGKHVHNLSAMTEGEARTFADVTQGRECVAYLRSGDGLMESPNVLERLILRLVGWKPALAGVLTMILPTALASCVSRPPAGTQPLAGVPLPPGKEEAHQSTNVSEMKVGKVKLDPAPVPGKPALPSN